MKDNVEIINDTKYATDYYPFGMGMPGRTYTAPSNNIYRFGFNGKEGDNELKGNGNSIDYGFKIYEPRLGRFLSVDPLSPKYPELTPYQFASNMPIHAIDIDGLETSKLFSTDMQMDGYKPVGGDLNLKPILAPILSSYSLAATIITLPYIGNVIREITGNYPDWAVPYTFNKDLKLIGRPDFLNGIPTWEQTKEIWAMGIGLILPPIAQTESQVANKVIDLTYSTVVSTAISYIPPNTTENTQSTSNNNTSNQKTTNKTQNSTTNTSTSKKSTTSNTSTNKNASTNKNKATSNTNTNYCPPLNRTLQ